MPAPSLVDSCTRACIKNIRSLNDVGDFEYWKIRPVLLRLESPAQLRIIETNSPQIRGEDEEIWRKLIARDIPNWATKNYIPKNRDNWYKVYEKYKKEQRIEIARDEERLREQLAGIKKVRDVNVSKVVDLRSLPKIPRDREMIANGGKLIAGRKMGGFKKEGASSLVWSAGSKTKLTDGKSVLTRARREAKEMSQRGKLAKPTHQLQIGQVRKAPTGMVNEYRRAAEPPIRILARKNNPVGKLPAGGPSLEEKEQRLRAAMMKNHSPAGVEETMIEDSDSEELESDDLFDEAPKPQSRPIASSSLSRPSSRPISTTRKPPHASSSPVSAEAKPSDLISSLISKPKPKPRPSGSSPAPPARPSSSTEFRRSPSPSHNAKRPLPPMMQRKRQEVDVFNRKPKRPRFT